MVVELLAAVFALCFSVLGWIRGLWVQVLFLLAVAVLYSSFDLWFPHLDPTLQNLGPALAELPFARKMVGFIVGYFVLVVVAALVEALLLQQVDELRGANRALGSLLGLVKGLVYGAVLIWIVEAAVLWGQEPGTPKPRWMATSVAFEALAPWNPLRVMTLKHRLEEHLARQEQEQRWREIQRRAAEKQAAGLDAEEAREQAEQEALEAQIAAREGGRELSEAEKEVLCGTWGWSPALEVREPQPLEEDARLDAIIAASPVMKLLDETASAHEWEGRTYGELVMDPQVQAVLGDASIADLLFGD